MNSLSAAFHLCGEIAYILCAARFLNFGGLQMCAARFLNFGGLQVIQV